VFRLGLNYKLLPFMHLRASWGQGYRFPTIAESFIKTSVGPVKVYPNPTLRPETGSNTEAGLRLFWGRKGGGIYTDFSVFDMRYRNMMEFTFSQWSSDIGPGNLFGFGFMSVNVGNTRVRGAELSVGGDFYTGKLHWQVLGGYTWTSPQVEDPDFVYGLDSLGRKLTFRETRSDENNILKYRYRNMARLDVQAGYKQWELGWSFRYNGPIENIDRAFVSLPINLFILDVDRARLDNSSGVYIMDARLAWRFRPKSASRLAFLVNNITNQVYMTRPADLRPPRSFQIQLLAEF
jgi:iron complex outermembrane receptor protein